MLPECSYHSVVLPVLWIVATRLPGSPQNCRAKLQSPRHGTYVGRIPLTEDPILTGTWRNLPVAKTGSRGPYILGYMVLERSTVRHDLILYDGSSPGALRPAVKSDVEGLTAFNGEGQRSIIADL
ncbi:hypothetical protein C7212DRAFT_348702 [Tuber magnatum]|uniref:Uncharacterized protein n=1 Tax=Tuber magnatum TaxID=42249 RepID=A0A317SB51_9PEZI|nr:hypothetical protein C7212DRAFT_348702 [Tuber magnatum]